MSILRFNEFIDEWTILKIKDIISSDSSNLSMNNLENNFGEYPLYGADGYIKNVDFYQKKDKYVAIVKDGAGVGRLKLLPKNSSVLSTLNYLIPNNKVDTYFVYYLLKTLNFNKYIVGSTIPHIYFKDYSNEKIKVPTLKEQKKIAEFLLMIDKKIDLLEKKLSLYQSLLKFYIENLFNQKIKIKKFNDKWEEKEIKDIFVERNERNYNELDLLSVTINEGVKKRIEINSIDNSSDDKSKYKHVCTGDIPYNSMRMWQGASGVSPYEGIISPAYTVLKPKKDVYSNFFGYYFKTNKMLYEFRKYSQGLTSDTWNLKYPLISEIKIKIPSFSDQIKIFNFLNIFERKINIIKNFIEAMTKFKIGLIQQMFI